MYFLSNLGNTTCQENKYINIVIFSLGVTSVIDGSGDGSSGDWVGGASAAFASFACASCAASNLLAAFSLLRSEDIT